MSCTKETINSAEPCLICGKPDYCYRLRFKNGSTMHCCARTESSSVFSNGKEYVFLRIKNSPIGTYFYYQEKTEMEESRKAYVEHLKASGQYKPGYKSKTTTIGLGVTYTTVSSKKDTYISGECPVASVDRLNKVYNRLMQLLILEPSDLSKLKGDWNGDITGHKFTDLILKTYPIKSLPPEDSKRSVLKRKILNRTRKDISAQLYKEFGSLAGIPGFYQEDDGSWNLAGSEGILFPCYNAAGKMRRMRIRESYPEIQTTFNGAEGSMKHVISKYGDDLWFFTPKGCKDSELVWGNKVQKITLKKDGCPKGKASGKYKNLASIYEKKNDAGNLFNAYHNGTRSGSSISVYDKYATDYSVVYITEGEKKAIVANMLLKVPVISLPGTGTFMKLFEPDEDGVSTMDAMIRKGLKLAVIAYDADKGENIRVLSAEQGAIAEFKSRQISIAIGEWNANFGKGLDDILVTGIMPSVYMCN